MDDLTICKRIAEIEGLVVIDTPDHIHIAIPVGEIKNHNHWSYEYSDYNPLVDDALCFQLMVKYKVNLRFYIDGSMCAFTVFSSDGFIDEDTNRAICLAIIEAHS